MHEHVYIIEVPYYGYTCILTVCFKHMLLPVCMESKEISLTLPGILLLLLLLYCMLY